MAAALGVQARVLRWVGGKLGSGVQAAARRARHRLLAVACAEAGAHRLLIGHTRDDALETLFMRAARQVQRTPIKPAMPPVAPSPAWPEGAGLALLRPLVGTGRAELRARLRAAGCSWIEDPSNEDDIYERVRARHALAGQGRGLAAVLLERQAEGAAEERAAREEALLALRAVRERPWGGWEIVRAAFRKAAPAGQGLALEALVGAASGVPAPLSREAVLDLRERILSARPFTGATLGGAAFAPADDGSAVTVGRDPGAVLGRREGSAPPELLRGVWDGRFHLEGSLEEGEVLVPAHGFQKSLDADDRRSLQAAPPIARRTAPLLLADGRPPRLPRGAFIGSQALARRVLPHAPPAWSSVGSARAALGLGSATPHMDVQKDASPPTVSLPPEEIRPA